MQRIPYKSSPVTRFVAIALGAVVAVLSLVVGAALFLALLGIAAVALAIFYVRLRWRLRRAAASAPRSQSSGQIIEGEYVVEQERQVEERSVSRQ